MSPLFIPDARLQQVADATQWRMTVNWGSVQQLFESVDIIEVRDFQCRVDASWQDAIRVSVAGNMDIEVVAGTLSANAFLETTRTQGWRNPAITLELLLPSGAPESIVAWKGILESWVMAPGRLGIRGQVTWPWDPRQLLCRDYALTMEGIAASLGRSAWLPQVFGKNLGVPATPLFRVSSVPLDAKLAQTDTSVHLRSLPTWPPAGRVQIDEEVFTYTQLLDNPPRLSGLGRATPLQHARGSAVHLLPTGDVRWAAADHPATIHAIHGNRPDGPDLNDLTVEFAGVAGRIDTVIRAGKLPLAIEHTSFAIPWETKPDAASWDTLPGSTAEFASDAFAGPNAQSGARFSAAKPLLVAEYLLDESSGDRRNDLVESLKLGFELSSRFNYTRETQFVVTVVRGMDSVVHVFSDFQSLAREGRFSGSGRVLPTLLYPDGKLDAGDRRSVIAFDEVHSLSITAWENAGFSIDGGFNTWARRNQGAGEAAISLRVLLHRDKIGHDRRIGRLGLFARVRAEGSPCAVRLSARRAGIFDHVCDAIAGTEWSTIGSIAGTGLMERGNLLGAESFYELSLPSGGVLQVAEMWLEVEFELAAAPRIAEPGGSDLPIAGLVEQSLPFFPLEVDITPLMPAENPWAVFSGLRIRFELLNAPQTYSLQVRNTRWTGRIRPVTSIEIVERLYTDITGRVAESDGLCGPAAVIQELLQHEDFAFLPDGEIDSAAFEAAAIVLFSLKRRFRAWFANEVNLGATIERALGESAALLVQSSGNWGLALLDQKADGSEPTVATESQLLEFPESLVCQPGALKSSVLAIHRSSENTLLDSAGRFGGDGGASHWQATWLAAGVARLAETAFTRFGTARQRIVVPVRSGWLAIPGGHRIRLAADAFGLTHDPAQVLGFAWQRGVVSLECELAPSGRTLFGAGDGFARQLSSSGRLLLSIGELLVASFQPDGSMRLRGEVKEFMEVTARESVLHWDATNRQLVFSAGPPDGRFAMAITEEGDLLLPGELREFVDQPDTPPSDGWVAVDDALVFGSPVMGTVARFDAEALKVGGEVKEGMEV